MSDARSGHTGEIKDTHEPRAGSHDEAADAKNAHGARAEDAGSDHPEEKLVSAKAGSAAHTKSGGSQAVDTKGGVVGPSNYHPAGADQENLASRVSETDPNYLEAWRKTDEGRKFAGDAARTPKASRDEAAK